MSLRIAFVGASGTGKSTLAQHLVEAKGLPLNPVGARSVAVAMGFATPYDADSAGRRAELQRRLLEEKVRWEAAHDSFVTDRTTMDNLAYQTLHDVRSVSADTLAWAITGLQRYTHVFYCPVDVFCNTAGDPARVPDLIYHQIFDVLVRGMVEQSRACKVWTVEDVDLVERKEFLDVVLEGL